MPCHLSPVRKFFDEKNKFSLCFINFFFVAKAHVTSEVVDSDILIDYLNFFGQ